MIYNGQDGVFSISEGKSRDQVHSYLLEGSGVRRDRNSVEWGFLPMSNNFVLLTDSTSFDVISDPVIHCWPLVELLCSPDCFIPARVSSCHVIISVCHNRS